MDLQDIQGNTLRGYKHPFAMFWFVRFADPESSQMWLSRIIPLITTSEDWGNERPDSTLNIAFTYPGLEAMKVAPAVLASFPVEFRQGMASRSDFLGDRDSHAPTNWEEPWNQEAVRNGIHAVISIYGTTCKAIEEKAAIVFSGVQSHLLVVASQSANRFAEDREHFGFRDGISNPTIEGINICTHSPLSADGTSFATETIAAGEFFTGYAGEAGFMHQSPLAPFDQNATFLVFRKIYQDVHTFRTYVESEAAKRLLDPELLAAKMVGRWKDGTPLVESPDQPNAEISADRYRSSQFSYQSDLRGIRCPLGAHIRRANPRDSLPGGVHAVVGHRMLRRGVTYGDVLESPQDDGADRGLLFMACVRNIREQFEFVLRLWINDSGFTSSLDPAEKDPLIGNNAETGWMTIPMTGFPRRLLKLPNFVRLRFGAYFVVPGIRALQALSNTSSPLL